MKRTLAMLLALALLLLCACSAAAEPLPDHAAQDDAASEPAQPLFWQVSGNGYSGSFYLLGSIHVSDGLTYPQELLDAYAACDTLAVESDVLALEADLSAQVEMMRCLVYTDGTTIDAHLDAQTYADAKQVLTDLGGYQTMLDHYMPIFWYLLAGNLALAQTRFSPDGGVDRYFLQMAKADGTEILEVEQYTDVYRALGALSEETQVYALQQAIRPEVLAATEEDTAALLDAWCSGDAAAIIDLLEAEPDEPLTPEEEAAAEEFGRTLVTDRNAVMIRAADEALRDSLRRAGFTDEAIDGQLRMPGSKFLRTFALSPQEAVARLQRDFPESFTALHPGTDGRVRLSFRYDAPVGTSGLAADAELTPAERATVRNILRNGCPVRTVRTSRTISTGACQLILERTGEAGYALRTLFPGELAPPLPLPGQVPDPFWATHLLIEFN